MTRAGAEPTRNLTCPRADPAMWSEPYPGCFQIAALVGRGAPPVRSHRARRVGSNPCRPWISLEQGKEPELPGGQDRSCTFIRTNVLLHHPTWCTRAPNNDVRGLYGRCSWLTS
jgi:hypothetical protein